jgi:hypothetical protein
MLVKFLLRPLLKGIINIYFITLVTYAAISLQDEFSVRPGRKIWPTFGVSVGETFSNLDPQSSSTAELSGPW